MVELSYPGVYVKEVPPTARAITSASTSTAAFIGVAERGPVEEPILVTSFTEFQQKFGGFTTKELLGISPAEDPDVYLPYAVWAFFLNGGRRCYIVRLAPDATEANGTAAVDSATWFKVRATSPGIWGNGIEVMVSQDEELSTSKLPAFRVDVLMTNEKDPVEIFEGLVYEKQDKNFLPLIINGSSQFIRIEEFNGEIRPVLKKASSSSSSSSRSKKGGDHEPSKADSTPKHTSSGPPPETPSTGISADASVTLSIRLKDGKSGKDVSPDDIVSQLSSGSKLDRITDVSLIAAPGYTDEQVVNTGFTYSEGHRNHLGDAFFIGDIPKDRKDRDSAKNFVRSNKFQPNQNGYGAVYFPWVKVQDQVAKGRNAVVLVPPSGFVAGMCAKIDNTRGVWKSPAGTEAGISGHLGLALNLTDEEQGVINKVGINAFRTFPGYGTVIWGARTVSSDTAWRYVSVRRMANFLKSSIYDGIQWAVFEPNDEPLWSALRLTIGGFMRDLFRQNAFQGATPEEAYFVKCDSETTSATDQQNGIVNILVGFAPLKPAEFVVVSLSQKTQPQE